MSFLQNKLKTRKETLRFIFLWTFILGFVAHGFCYFNQMYSHDSLLVYQNDDAWQITLGRFMTRFYLKLRGRFYTPSFIGILSLLFIALSVYLIVKLLSIEKSLSTFLICGVMATNLVVTMTNANYIFCTDCYMLALLFSVIGVWTARKYKFGFLIAPLFFCVTLGIYQAYFQVAVVFLMILVIKDILDSKETKDILYFGIKSLISLFLGLIVYYISLQLVLKTTGLSLSTGYNGINSVGHFESLSSLITNFIQTYKVVFSFFKEPILYQSKIMSFVNAFLLLISIIFLIGTITIKKIRGWNLAILFILIPLLPFGTNFVCFLSKGNEHHLTRYAFFFVYIFAIYLADNFFTENMLGVDKLQLKKYAIGSLLVPGAMSIFIFNSIVYSNAAYLKMDLICQNTRTTMTRIIDRIEQVDGYVVGETPVVFVGSLEKSKLRDEYFPEVSSRKHLWTDGLNAQALAISFATSYVGTETTYLRRLWAYPINILTYEGEKWQQKEEVQNMPTFPSKDACKMIDGTLVVKLS